MCELCVYKMSHFVVINVIIIVITSQLCLAENSGQCQIDANIEWDSNLYENTAVNDNETIETKLTFTGKLEVNVETSSYLTIQVEDNALVFRSNDNFTRLDSYVPTQNTDTYTFPTNIILTCDEGDSSLTFIQPVKDTNNNPPEFDATVYEYTIPIPLIPGYDLTAFGPSITVTDLDFSNQNILFNTPDSNYFTVETVNLGNKQYRAVIRVSAITYLSEDTEFSISATDQGLSDNFVAQTTSTKFKIIIDENLSEPEVPSFAAPSYTMDYTVKEGSPLLTLTSDVIQVQSSHLQTVEVTSDDSTNFKIEYDQTNGRISIAAVNLLEDNDRHAIILTLNAKVNGATESASSVVVISIIQASVPKFSATYYTAQYTVTEAGDHNVTLDQDIALTENADGIQVALAGESSENFQLTQINQLLWTLSIIDNLPDNILNTSHELLLTLIVSKTDNDDIVDSSTLVVILPEIPVPNPPVFGQAHYSGNYNNSENVANIDLEDGPITITGDGTLAVAVVDKFIENFEIKYDSDSDECHLNVIKDLDEDILSGNTEILVTLQATSDSVADKVFATVMLKLPQPVTPTTPKFSSFYYHANYTLNDNNDETDYIVLGEDIVIISENADVTSVKIIDIAYTDYFETNYNTDSTSWEIIVKKDLNQDVLNKENELILTLQATLDTEVSSAIVLLSLPVPNKVILPKFTDTYYTANYQIEDDNHTIDITSNPIALDETVENVEVVLSGTYADHFTIKFDSATEQWQVSISDNLDENILGSEIELLLILEATIPDLTDQIETATLIIILPDQLDTKIPKFTNTYYTADYQINGNTHSIEMTSNGIALQNSSEETSIVLSGNYSDYFKLQFDSDTSQWQLSVANSLDEEVLQTEKELLLILEVILPGGSDQTETATLIITLPEQNTIPKFTETYYTYNYLIVDNGTDYVELSGSPIAIDDITVEAVVQINGNYLEYFQLNQDSETKQWTLSLTGNLDEELLASENKILLILEETVSAIADKKETATLIITLPDQNQLEVPKFTETYYTADYLINEDNGTHFVELTSSPIALTKDTEETSIEITGKYSEYFEVNLDSENNIWQLSLNETLEEEVLNTVPEILLILESTVSDLNNEKETATLIITLPIQRNSTKVPKFTETYYTAKYTIDDDQHKVEIIKSPIALQGSLEEVSVNFQDGNYSNYFNLQFDADTNQWQLSLASELDEDVLQSENELLLILEASIPVLSDQKETATLIIILPEQDITEIPKFTETYYTGNYVIADNGTHSAKLTGSPIELTSEIAEVSIEITGKYSECFNLNLDLDSNQWQLLLIDNLDDTVLSTDAELLLVLEETVMSLEDQKETATLIITLPIHENFTEIPKFTETYYTAEYSIHNDHHNVEITKNPIALQSSSEEAEVVLSGNYSNFFNLQFNDDLYQWELSLVDDLDDETLQNEQELLLILEATLSSKVSDAKETATLIIILPEQNVIDIPKFTETYYTSDYVISANGTHYVELTGSSIALTEDIDNVLIQLTGNYLEYFEVNLDSASNQWQLSLLKNLDDEILDTESNILLILEETVFNITDRKETATLVVTLPNQEKLEAPKFTEAYYTADYVIVENDTDSIEWIGSPIAFTNDTTRASIQIDGTYSDNFKLDYDDSSSTWLLSIATNLDDEILADGYNIILTLEATLEGFVDKELATLIVNLPRNLVVVNPPRFSSILYTAEYLQADTDDNYVINMTSVGIQIANDPANQAEVILTGLHSEYFRVDLNSDNNQYYNLLVENQIPDDILENTMEIILTIEASFSETTTKGYANLIISLPAKVAVEVPTFSNILYTGNYEVLDNGTHNIVITGNQITITNNDETNTADLILVDTYAEYFKIQLINTGINGEYEIVVVANLDDIILATETEIVLSIEASFSSDSLNKGYSKVLVKLPETTSTILPIFSSSYYTASYQVVDDNLDTVNVNGIITLTNDEADQISVQVTGDYENNFEVTYIEASQEWQLTVILDLNNSTLETETTIILTLAATLSGSSSVGYANVFIELPRNNDGVPLTVSFLQTYYTATYQIETNGSHSIELDDDGGISVSNNDADVTLSGNYAQYFSLIHNQNQWQLSIAENLDETILNNDQNIILELVAVVTGAVDNATATLLVKLPEIVDATFDKAHYIASYSVEDNKHSITTETISISTTEANVIVAEDYSDNFNISCTEERSCELYITNNLSDDVLNTQLEIIVTLEITRTNSAARSSRALVILSLPLKESLNTLIFTNTAYTATYTVQDGDDPDIVQITNGPITISGQNLTTIQIELTGTYAENFILSLNNNQWDVTVTSDLADNDLYVGGIVVLTLTATLEDSLGATSRGETTLIIKLPDAVVTSVINFSEIVYKAQYIVNDKGDDSLSIDNSIIVEGESLDQIVLSMSGDYSDHFQTLPNQNGQVSFSLVSDLPDDVLKEKSVVVLTIRAVLPEAAGNTWAAVVITLPLKDNDNDNDDDKDDKDVTAYIAVIAVLSILLVGFIVGSGAFYYFKILRRGSNYKQMTDGDTKFTKNPNLTEVKKMEPVTRRPTTGIRYSLNVNNEDESPCESTTDPDEIKERRKSVAFDENVKELKIDPAEDPEEISDKISNDDEDDVIQKTKL